MTKEELDRIRFGCSERQHRARLLYCMDYIMHNLNDEEALEDWLVMGPPDGLYQASEEPPAGEYDGVAESDEDFFRMTGVFIRTLALEGGYEGDGEGTVYDVGKAVLA